MSSWPNVFCDGNIDTPVWAEGFSNKNGTEM